MSSAPVKIPEMFLRAMKRRNESISSPKTDKVTTGGEATVAKIAKVAAPEHVEETKENFYKAAMPVLKSESAFSLRKLLVQHSWIEKLGCEFDKSYMKEIESFLRAQYEKKVKIFPPKEEIFSVFNLIPLKSIRVVVIGQDPYHNDGQAHGLSFSVKKGVKCPPSLVNIYKELSEDIPGFVTPDHGYLVGWAQQGVFMLNASLTVEAHKANSHANIGWQKFTDHVIKTISKETEGVVFLLWGGFAQKKESLVDSKKHAVVKTAHPSPLSVTKWRGCRCFSKTNDLLKKFNKKPIEWSSL